MKLITSFLATVLVMFIAFATSCASSDKDRAAADSIARADSVLHAYDQGIDLVAKFTKVAEKVETMTADSGIRHRGGQRHCGARPLRQQRHDFRHRLPTLQRTFGQHIDKSGDIASNRSGRI